MELNKKSEAVLKEKALQTMINEREVEGLIIELQKDFALTIKQGDKQRYKDFFTALDLAKVIIIQKIARRTAAGIPATDKELSLIYGFIDAKKKVNDVIYGSKNINVDLKVDAKDIIDYLQRKHEEEGIIRINDKSKTKKNVPEENSQQI